MINNRRYDLSDRVIHFFRKLSPGDGSTPILPDNWGEGNVAESTEISALFLMRSAIRSGRLWSTWSLRKGIRTIYGSSPAICFTEMPTAAFLEASATRLKAKEKISRYALTFPKEEIFSLGARPVIYGLSGSPKDIPSGKEGKERIIPSEILPLMEQYRYVTYSPAGSRSIDWTHEREWRWAYRGDITTFEAEVNEHGMVSEVTNVPGLDLYTSGLTGLGAIVSVEKEAEMVIHDILSLVDRKIIAVDTFKYVLVSTKIEPPEIRDPDKEKQAIANATIDLNLYLTPQIQRDLRLSERVHTIAQEIESDAGAPEPGEWGGCWLWLVDNIHPVTRALVNEGQVIVNNGGKYLMYLDEFSDDRSLAQRQEMTKELALRLREEFDVEAGYFSVLGSDDPNGIPFYNSDHLDNRLHYNIDFGDCEPE